MLQVFREKFAGGVALAILVLIGITFVFFGLPYDFGATSYAAKVDGETIDPNLFEAEYRDALQRNPSLLDVSRNFRVQIRSAVLDGLIREQLIDNYLDEAGYRISDKQVMDLIQQTPEFQVNGKFDMQTYRDYLASQGLDPVRFEALQRQRMREQQLQVAIVASSIVTPAEYRRYLNLVAEERAVRLATFSEESVADEVEVTEDMIVSFYENNPSMYQLPEEADVQYVALRRDRIADTVTVTEDALAQYYEEQKYRYEQEEQRQARHILLLTEDDADAETTAAELVERIEAGESFEDLAAEYSGDTLTAARGGDLGLLARSQLPGELGSAIFTMQEGEVVGPIRTDFGLHVIRLDRVVDPGPLPLAQVREELLAELRSDEAELAYRELERRVSDALFAATDLESLAVDIGLEVETIEGFTRSGGGAFGSNQAAIDAVFADRVLTGGGLSPLVETDANTAAVFQVVSYQEATRRPLEEVRDEVEAAVRSVEAERLLVERAENMLRALAEGAPFAEAAEAAGAEAGEPVTLSRRSNDVDRAVLSEVFSAPKPGDTPVTGRVANVGGGYTVYSLEAVIPGRPESIPLAERDAGKLQLAQQSGLGDLRAFIQRLYDEADIVVNNDVLAADDLLQ